MAKQSLAEKMAARKAAAAEAGTTEDTPVNPPEGAAAAKPPKPPKAAEEKTEKKKRGRPPKAAKEAAEPSPAQTLGFTLYINCHPIKSPTPALDARTILTPITIGVATEHGVADYRMIEYGQGPAHLADARRKHLTANPITGVSITVDAKTDEGRHVVGVLQDFATTIVRGF